jgi:hypothetical protein
VRDGQLDVGVFDTTEQLDATTVEVMLVAMLAPIQRQLPAFAEQHGG